MARIKQSRMYWLVIAYIIVQTAATLFIGHIASAAPGEQYPPGYDYTCPAGHYPIGNGACKKEPSGCPFYENIDAKGCIKPPYIECTDDTWTNCWMIDETAAPNAAQTTEPAKTTPTPNATQNPSNSTPNAPNTGNVAPSYAAPAANDTANVNRTAETVDVAYDNVNENDDVSLAVQSAVRVSESPDIDTKAVENFGRSMIEGVIVLLFGAVTVCVWVWAEARHPGFTRNGIDMLKTRFREFTKRH